MNSRLTLPTRCGAGSIPESAQDRTESKVIQTAAVLLSVESPVLLKNENVVFCEVYRKGTSNERIWKKCFLILRRLFQRFWIVGSGGMRQISLDSRYACRAKCS